MSKPRPCAKCPKYNPRNHICAIRAQYMTPSHPSCEYGRRLISNEWMAEYNRQKRGSKKRPAPPEPTPADWDRLNNAPAPAAGPASSRASRCWRAERKCRYEDA